MTDVIDKASEIEQRERDYLIKANKPVKELPNEFDGHRYCVECDIELNTKRLDAAPNAVRCVPCQEVCEHQQKQYKPRRL